MNIQDFQKLVDDLLEGLNSSYKRLLNYDFILEAKMKQVSEIGHELLPDYKGFFRAVNDKLEYPTLYGHITIKDTKRVCESIKEFISTSYPDSVGSQSLDPVTNLRYTNIEEINFNEHETVSLAIVDVDDLGKINEKGYDKGDEALKHVASTLKTLEKNCLVLRAHGKNGDEFIIIADGMPKNVLYAMIEDCREKICYKTISDGIKVTVSVGISSYPSDGKNRQEVMKKADNALKCSKKHGKNMITKSGEEPETNTINFRFEGEMDIKKGSKILVKSWRNHHAPSTNELEAVEVTDIDNDIHFTSKNKGTTMTFIIIKKEINGITASVRRPHGETLFTLRVPKKHLDGISKDPKDYRNPLVR